MEVGGVGHLPSGELHKISAWWVMGVKRKAWDLVEWQSRPKAVETPRDRKCSTGCLRM